MKLIVKQPELAKKLDAIDLDIADNEQYNLIIIKTPYGLKKIKTNLELDEWKKANNFKNGKKGNTKPKPRKKNK
jgi:hypothetical protein